MLRVTVITKSEQTVLKAEGKLAGPWASELERCWRMAIDGSHKEPVVVDLSDVSFVDLAGKELIRTMYQRGAKLVVTGPLMTSLIKQMRSESAGPKARNLQEAR